MARTSLSQVPSSFWFPRSSSEVRHSFGELGRTAQTYLPLSLWPPRSVFNCPITYCSSVGSRMSFHDEHFHRHFALSSLQYWRKSPRVVMCAWAVYDGHQSPDFGVVGQPTSCYGGSLHSLDSGPYLQEGQGITMSSLSAVFLHVLRVFADASGSLQSDDISTPAVWQHPSIGWLRPNPNSTP